VKDGSWMLMVYDQNGAARLIRGASFPAPPKTDQAPGAPNSPGAANSPNPVNQNTVSQVPPPYVTGVYDATWAQPPAPPQGQEVVSENTPALAPAPESAYGQNAAGSTSTPSGPGQVSVTPRQIAVTTENVTVELEIT